MLPPLILNLQLLVEVTCVWHVGRSDVCILLYGHGHIQVKAHLNLFLDVLKKSYMTGLCSKSWFHVYPRAGTTCTPLIQEFTNIIQANPKWISTSLQPCWIMNTFMSSLSCQTVWNPQQIRFLCWMASEPNCSSNRTKIAVMSHSQENNCKCTSSYSIIQPSKYFFRPWFCNPSIYILPETEDDSKLRSWESKTPPRTTEAFWTAFPTSSIMSNIVAAVLATASIDGKSGGRRLIPRRGQIKTRIAATAVHSISSMLLRALPQLSHHKWVVVLLM